MWRHFQLSATDTQHAWCAVPHCPLSRRRVPRTRGNTKGLQDHLREYHRITEAKPAPAAADVRTLFAAQARAEAIPACTDSYRATMNNYVAQFFVANCLSFNVADSPQFVSMLHFASHRSYLPPARTAVTQACDKLYQSMVEVLLLDVKDNTISITTDAATLDNGHSYLTVTAHYITRDMVEKCKRVGSPPFYLLLALKNNGSSRTALPPYGGNRFDRTVVFCDRYRDVNPSTAHGGIAQKQIGHSAPVGS